jgi:hypothetical protein
MLVKMLNHITGLRNGVAWPPRGGIADLPNDEANALIAHGYAVPLPIAPATMPEEPREEAAVITPIERATKVRRKRG